MTSNAFANSLGAAMRAGAVLEPDPGLALLSPAQARAVQIEACHLAGLRPGAWKLGASNFASREALGLEECFLGPISEERVHVGSSLTLPHPVPIVEAEIAVRLNLKSWLEAPEATLDNHLISVHPAFELPESRFGIIGAAGTGGLIADFGAAGAAVIGDGIDPASLVRRDQRLSCRFSLNGQFEAEGDTSALVAEPLELLEQQRSRFLEYPFLPETAYILLGALTAIRNVRPGDEVVCEFELLGTISVDF